MAKKKLTVVTAAEDVEENPYLLVVGMQESTVTMKKVWHPLTKLNIV